MFIEYSSLLHDDILTSHKTTQFSCKAIMSIVLISQGLTGKSPYCHRDVVVFHQGFLHTISTCIRGWTTWCPHKLIWKLLAQHPHKNNHIYIQYTCTRSLVNHTLALWRYMVTEYVECCSAESLGMVHQTTCIFSTVVQQNIVNFTIDFYLHTGLITCM